jgi:hypothetical protein
MTITNALYYTGAAIRFTCRYFVFYPAIALFLLLAVVSEFSFSNLFTEAYGYVSKVSQIPAESELHVNQEVCKRYTSPGVSVEREILPPPVKCEEWALESISIAQAANKSAEVAEKLYIYLVVFMMIFDIGYKVIIGRYQPQFAFVDSVFTRIFHKKSVSKKYHE